MKLDGDSEKHQASPPPSYIKDDVADVENVSVDGSQPEQAHLKRSLKSRHLAVTYTRHLGLIYTHRP